MPKRTTRKKPTAVESWRALPAKVRAMVFREMRDSAYIDSRVAKGQTHHDPKYARDCARHARATRIAARVLREVTRVR